MERTTKVVDEATSAYEVSAKRAHSDPAVQPAPAIAEAKARQSSKIRELKSALQSAGLIALDEQARALGLCRSTTWQILRGEHKTSGLSATIVNRMLSAPRLPPIVRQKILEYVAERANGLYGHSKTQADRFLVRIVSATFR